MAKDRIILAFLKLFLESQNHREKLNLWGRNWDHWQDNFLKKDYIFFWIFWHLRHFRAISLWKKQGPFRPWSFWWGLKESLFLKFFDILCNKASRWSQKFAIGVTKLMPPDEIRRFDGTMQPTLPIFRSSSADKIQDCFICVYFIYSKN